MQALKLGQCALAVELYTCVLDQTEMLKADHLALAARRLPEAKQMLLDFQGTVDELRAEAAAAEADAKEKQAALAATSPESAERDAADTAAQLASATWQPMAEADLKLLQHEHCRALVLASSQKRAGSLLTAFPAPLDAHNLAELAVSSPSAAPAPHARAQSATISSLCDVRGGAMPSCVRGWRLTLVRGCGVMYAACVDGGSPLCVGMASHPCAWVWRLTLVRGCGVMYDSAWSQRLTLEDLELETSYFARAFEAYDDGSYVAALTARSRMLMAAAAPCLERLRAAGGDDARINSANRVLGEFEDWYRGRDAQPTRTPRAPHTTTPRQTTAHAHTPNHCPCCPCCPCCRVLALAPRLRRSHGGANPPFTRTHAHPPSRARMPTLRHSCSSLRVGRRPFISAGRQYGRSLVPSTGGYKQRACRRSIWAAVARMSRS
jgi:hypothetical protein